MSAATQSAEAWLLECGSVRALVSVLNMQHVIEAGQLFHVPMMPAHCNSAMVWQKHVMPVVNIATWMQKPVSTCRYTCIIGWQDIQRGSEYGVLAATSFPQRTKIYDADCVEPSAELANLWKQCALCFVKMGNEIIPVIDPARLFGASQFAEQKQVQTIGKIA